MLDVGRLLKDFLQPENCSQPLAQQEKTFAVADLQGHAIHGGNGVKPFDDGLEGEVHSAFFSAPPDFSGSTAGRS